MVRILALVSGLIGALSLSQYPEFSQQYLQRLSGAVNELRLIVEDFDASADRAGMTRQDALDDLPETGIAGDLKVTMERTIRRFERLDHTLRLMRERSNPTAMALPWHMMDREIVQDTWSDYAPAVPVTVQGVIATGIGFVGGWGSVLLIAGLLRLLIRRRWPQTQK